jgi:hypothetical protein
VQVVLVARTSVCSVGFSRRLRILSNLAEHRLKPMLQAEARATFPRSDLLSVFLTQDTSAVTG